MNKYFNTKSAAAAMAAAITGIATVAGSVAFAAGPAWADTTTTTTAPAAPATTAVVYPDHVADRLAWVKKDSDRLVQRRVATLDKFSAEIQKLTYLGTDQAALETEIQADVTGLQALDAKIQADTDLKTALADRAQIFTSYRVYLLMLPVVSAVTRTDWYVNFKVPAVNTQIAQLQSQENSSNQSVIAPLVAGMQSQVNIVTTATNGLSAQLLAFTPAQWDANHRLLVTANSDLRLSARAITVAEHDYATAEQYLRTGHIGSGKHGHKA